MPKIKPWSFSSLDTFVGCPRKYHETAILKSVVEEETEAKQIGIDMHKAFEDRLSVDLALPPDMAQFEPFMQEIEAGPGIVRTERKVGINKRLEPCGFFDADVWWRGVIDVHKVRDDATSTIVDYKTGKPHTKMRQLHLFALYGFLEGQTQVEAMFYWTKTMTRTRIVLPASQKDNILRSLVPDLTDYKEAFRDDIWPPKRNHLCRNYCPVKECEFHGKGMNERV